MKPALIEDYNNVTYKALARSVLSNFLLENKKLPFYVAMDSSIIHFKPWSQVVFNPSVKSAWKTILERYYESDSYKKLNSAVAGDPMLAKYATIHFLNALFKKAKEQLKQLKKSQLSKKDKEDPVGSLLNLIDTQVSPEANKAVQAIVSALEEEAEEVLQDIEAIESFSHIGVPVANLLEKPDEFREKARNKIIIYLVKFLQRLKREAPNLKQTRAPTLIGLSILSFRFVYLLVRAFYTSTLKLSILSFRFSLSLMDLKYSTNFQFYPLDSECLFSMSMSRFCTTLFSFCYF
ncbi:MAG: hypothetical protein QXJ97_03185 [Desulfurococcaceae archaeon]